MDTSVHSQRFVTDCEICCRPFEVIAECEDGEILSVDVLSN
ncbi:MAG: CPXCG motif-containing cysteine-rich protein [Verrucomicrobiota bacterium]|nr:CPXCG motif-containing cysteine-rich protein [Verrucomicrobiota bacterium]